ncbi:MAG: recombinase family protein [Clostridiaceae bacterium]|nr:recombinase family protein [Lachnospiraceae bacterium]MCI8881386.1 recombinase family protein [Clostridiaceae bacterium]
MNWSTEEYLIYLRKSQADNPHESIKEVLEKHETQLQEFAEHELGCRIPESCIYREVVSGETIRDRIMINEVLKRIELGSIKGVITIEPQRLGRGDLEDCGKIVNAFRYSNTLVVTPVKTYNLQDKYDRKFFEMELQRGSDYLEYYKEIQARGRIASVKRGNYIGSVPPYGYKKTKFKEGNQTYFTLEILPEEAAVVRLIFDLYANQNYGFARIARKLDAMGIRPRKSTYWSPLSLKDMLENPVYTGKIRWNWRQNVKILEQGKIRHSRPKSDSANWILIEGKHEAIITDELFHAAIERKGRSPKVKAAAKIRNPWAGLLYCECGRAMSYRTYQKDGVSKSSPRLLCDGQTYCKNRSTTYQTFEDLMIDNMKHYIYNFEVLLKNENDHSHELHLSMIRTLEKELAELDIRDEEQHDLLEDGIYTKEVFLKRNKKLQERKQELLISIQKAKESVPASVSYEEKIIRFSDALDALQDSTITAEKKNALLVKCFDKIIYTNHNMDTKNNFSIQIYGRI